jgi:hypothetical protein
VALDIEQFYDPRSKMFSEGRVTVEPPVGYDTTGLVSRPSLTQGAGLDLIISGLGRQIEAATRAHEETAAHVAVLEGKAAADRDDAAIQREHAELAALRMESRSGLFPADRRTRLEQLQQRLEIEPARLLASLRLEADSHTGRVQFLQGRLASERELRRAVAEREQQHRDREAIAAGQRQWWRVATEADHRLLREAGVDANRIPLRDVRG